MQNNFTSMSLTVIGFVTATLIFMVVLHFFRRYRAVNSGGSGSYVDKIFVQSNFMQVCFGFAALYFIVFMFYAHSMVSCDSLDKQLRCQCYALELKYHKKLQDKLCYAEKGMQLCSDSKFFHDFYEANSNK